MLQTLSLILGSNVNIWLQKFMIKVAKMVGFVSCRVLSCIIRCISFLLFKLTYRELIFKKSMHVGYPMGRFLRYVNVDQVTMYYIGPGTR